MVGAGSQPGQRKHAVVSNHGASDQEPAESGAGNRLAMVNDAAGDGPDPPHDENPEVSPFRTAEFSGLQRNISNKKRGVRLVANPLVDDTQVVPTNGHLTQDKRPVDVGTSFEARSFENDARFLQRRVSALIPKNDLTTQLARQKGAFQIKSATRHDKGNEQRTQKKSVHKWLPIARPKLMAKGRKKPGARECGRYFNTHSKRTAMSVVKATYLPCEAGRSMVCTPK